MWSISVCVKGAWGFCLWIHRSTSNSGSLEAGLGCVASVSVSQGCLTSVSVSLSSYHYVRPLYTCKRLLLPMYTLVCATCLAQSASIEAYIYIYIYIYMHWTIVQMCLQYVLAPPVENENAYYRRSLRKLSSSSACKVMGHEDTY